MKRILYFILFFLFFIQQISTLEEKEEEKEKAEGKIKIHRVDTREFPKVQLEVSVSQITPLLNLDNSNFTLYENDWKVGYFKVKSSSDYTPTKYINIVINASADISTKEFEQQIESVKDFIMRTHPQNKISLTGFRKNFFNISPPATNKIFLLESLKKIEQSDEKPMLYDVFLDTIYSASRNNQSQNSVIFFTNGASSPSNMRLEDVIEELQKKNIVLYTISSSKGEYIKDLSRFTRLSGGQMYFVNELSDLSKIYLLIGELVNNTYLIEYESRAIETTKPQDLVEFKIILRHNETETSDRIRFYIKDNYAHELWEKFINNKKLLYYTVAVLGLIIIILFIKYLGKGIEDTRNQDEYNEYLPDEFIETRPYADKIDLTPMYSSRPKPVAVTPMPPKLKKVTVLRFAYLVEKEGPNVGKKYGLVKEEATIGSSTHNTIPIFDPAISPAHAKIKKKNMKFILYDLISDTGTYLNGKKLLRPKEINDFDEIRMGYTRLIFRKIYK
ncbi:MAG: FHA domain-containing protein [Spirochaetia bacterium]|nr:FHA domain-containing protein [Spirochaetia bacterium]